jgi:hypothetical protein
MRIFNKLYQHYKDNFDFELMLQLSHKTYRIVEKEQRKRDEIF